MPKSSLSHIERLSVDGLEIETSDARVVLRGKMTSRQPEASIQPHIRKIHDAATELPLTDVEVDVTELSFVNSSAIRLFVDWAMWAKGTTDTPHYRLTFKAKEGITWQRMTLTALTSLAPTVVRVETV